MTITTEANRIAALNDLFRTTFIGGKVMLTHGINTLPDTEKHEIIKAVQEFNAFTHDNDPWGEHDFGSFDCVGQRIMYKIDYYDATMTYGSEDPSDPSQTTRILTIMLASEY